MFKYFFILIYLISLAYSHADNKDKIIKSNHSTVQREHEEEVQQEARLPHKMRHQR